MTSFKQILEPPSETKSPRSSLVGAPPPQSRSSSPFPTLPTAKSNSPFTGSTNKEALWERAWSSWRQIGQEVVTRRLPSIDVFRSFLSSSPSHDAMDEFFNPLPTQGFLTQLLTVLTIIIRKLHSFTAQHLSTATQILEAVVLVPVPKDVSPFLVPAAHEDSMTSVQYMVLSGLGLLFTAESILDNPDSVKSSSNLFTRYVISNLDRCLELHEHQPLSPQLFTSIINQLLSFSLLAWTSPTLLSLPASANLSVAKLPVVVVNYSAFSLSSLVLAVQLCRSFKSHDLHVTTTIVERFIQVRLGSHTHSHTHTLTHTLTHPHTHPHTHPLTHTLTLSLFYLLIFRRCRSLYLSAIFAPLLCGPPHSMPFSQYWKSTSLHYWKIKVWSSSCVLDPSSLW